VTRALSVANPEGDLPTQRMDRFGGLPFSVHYEALDSVAEVLK
jgi:hypothetical protein